MAARRDGSGRDNMMYASPWLLVLTLQRDDTEPSGPSMENLIGPCVNGNRSCFLTRDSEMTWTLSGSSRIRLGSTCGVSILGMFPPLPPQPLRGRGQLIV